MILGLATATATAIILAFTVDWNQLKTHIPQIFKPIELPIKLE
uniref:Uncharacterized protein n=1 Tax=Planktothrix agardhii TaxID=1160 RepID=A0A1J1JL48_PLAAG|nr:exported protein of unknown function [Planktothrix agardhii]